MRCRRNGCGKYIAAMMIGILLAILLPVWLCFWIICGLLALICII